MSLAIPEMMADTAPEAALEAKPKATSGVTTLDRIPKGEIALVLDVRGDDPIARRLGDLGIREGVEIEVLRRAPMGDPTVFELCSYQLCLRRSESARVKVRALAHARASAAPHDSGQP